MRANTQFEKPIVPETLLKIETATSGGSFLSILQFFFLTHSLSCVQRVSSLPLVSFSFHF